MHKPSGLGIYAMGDWEDVSDDKNHCFGCVRRLRLGNA